MSTLTPHISAYISDRRANAGLHSKTLRAYRYRLRVLDETFGDRPLSQFGPKAVTRYAAAISDLSKNTQRQYRSTIIGFVRYLQREGLIRGDRDPCAHLEPIRVPPKDPITFTREEVATLLSSAPNLRAKAIIWLMVGLGARCIEVAQLMIEDYDPVSVTIRLRGKFGKERVIPVLDGAADVIEDYLDAYGWDPGRPMFRNKWTGAALDPQSVSIYLARWLASAGLKTAPYDGKTAHGLRRTAASDVMDACGDITLVQKMLGHSDPSVTARSYLARRQQGPLRDAMRGREYTFEEADRIAAEARGLNAEEAERQRARRERRQRRKGNDAA